jgi:L-serine/L-threonine ammonia-lyase
MGEQSKQILMRKVRGVKSVFHLVFLSFSIPLSQALCPPSIRVLSKRRISSNLVTMSCNNDRVAAVEARKEGLFLATPLIRSDPLSRLAQTDVYLKLDLLQRSGSFKDRGMAHLCHTVLWQGVRNSEGVGDDGNKSIQTLISSSGGNAGLAVASLGHKLHMSVTVVVPETTKSTVVEKLKSHDATVLIHGENWNAADQLARQMVSDDPTQTSYYVSPYDNPLIWTGHSTLIDEIIDDLPQARTSTTLILSVGGGGLLCGVLEGIERHDLSGITVVTSETEGTASFASSWEAEELITLPRIASVATSLGALQVTPEALVRAQRHVLAGKHNGNNLMAATCTDAEAVQACLQFAHDHRMLVEPACGAALAILYTERLRTKYIQERNPSPQSGPIVIELCGGSGVTLELLQQWKQDFSLS